MQRKAIYFKGYRPDVISPTMGQKEATGIGDGSNETAHIWIEYCEENLKKVWSCNLKYRQLTAEDIVVECRIFNWLKGPFAFSYQAIKSWFGKFWDLITFKSRAVSRRILADSPVSYPHIFENRLSSLHKK